MSAFQSAKDKQVFPSTNQQRLQIEYLMSPSEEPRLDHGQEVIAGLTQDNKSLPARYFYDELGSQLFEQICQLPEYYLTRTEASILENSTPALARTTGACELVELGSGSSTKTRFIIDAYRNLGYPLHYCPIDVSVEILEKSSRQLLKEYPSIEIQALVGTYEQALEQLTPAALPARMICFLGSTIGNLNQKECEAFLQQINQALTPGDYFLLGIDLAKSPKVLEAAYNDSQGITAAFNLNILRHLNWRFGGNFNIDKFSHRAFFNEDLSQIEMHLVSQEEQTVELRELGLKIIFGVEETILTEISRKFNLEKMQGYLASQGLNPLKTWTDPKQWFGLLLCQR